nr:MAG TPA: hypothetical protein [Caudoviricetes sp.]
MSFGLPPTFFQQVGKIIQIALDKSYLLDYNVTVVKSYLQYNTQTQDFQGIRKEI